MKGLPMLDSCRLTREALWLILALILAAGPSLADGCLASDDGQLREFVRVSPRDPRYLELTDGQPFIPIGLNIAATGDRADAAEGLQEMERWMKRLAANRGNFVRVWLSSPFWDVEHETCGVYDQRKARRIDALLELARRYRIRLKLTFEHFREIDPNSEYAKHRAWSTKPLHHVSRGGTANSIADWFDGPRSRRQFKKKLAWYANRYGNDPAVFGWELWNEVNAVRGGDYLAWTEAMLPELRSRFPKHLVMQSLGSYDHARRRDVYRQMCTMSGNDLAQVHRYLDLGANMEVCHGPVDVLAADAVRELLRFRPGRPILLAESGAVEPGHTGPFKLYRQDHAGIILHDVIFAPFFTGAAGTGQSWHWQQYVDANKLWWHFRRFAEAVEGIDPPAEDFQPRMIDHPRLRVYVLRGKKTSLVWCRDRKNTWREELAERIAPETITGATLKLGSVAADGDRMIRIYDPWQDQWTTQAGSLDRVRLPAFTRSIVLRIERSEPGR